MDAALPPVPVAIDSDFCGGWGLGSAPEGRVPSFSSSSFKAGGGGEPEREGASEEVGEVIGAVSARSSLARDRAFSSLRGTTREK